MCSQKLLKVFEVVFPRLVSGSGIILLSLLTPIVMSIEESAVFLVGISLLYLMFMLSKVGLDVLLIKEAAISEKRVNARQFTYILIPVFLASTLSLVAFLLSEKVPYMKEFYWVLLTLPNFVLLGMCSSLLRGKGHDSASAYSEVGIVSFLVSLILTIFLVLRLPMEVGLVFAWASFSISVFFAFYIFCKFRFELAFELRAQDFLSARYFLYSQLASYLTQWLPLYFIATYDAKLSVYYAVANRMAGVITFLGVTIDMYSAPRFASARVNSLNCALAYKRKMDRLSLLVVLAILPVMILVSVVYGQMVNYEHQYYLISLALIIGYALAVALGPNGYFLMMSGYEKLAYEITKYSFFLICIFSVISWGFNKLELLPFFVALCVVARAAVLKIALIRVVKL